MSVLYDLKRFLDQQAHYYERAKAELLAGRKQSHYMWFIFPQLKGLGKSVMSEYYGIDGIEEAKAYLMHPLLSSRLFELCDILLALPINDAFSVFGSPDDKKLRSSMTLFHLADSGNARFASVLDKFFEGKLDGHTVLLLERAAQSSGGKKG